MNNLLSALLKVGTRALLIWVIIHFRNTGELLLSPKMLIRSFSLPNDRVAGTILLFVAIAGAVLVWYYKNEMDQKDLEQEKKDLNKSFD